LWFGIRRGNCEKTVLDQAGQPKRSAIQVLGILGNKSNPTREKGREKVKCERRVGKQTPERKEKNSGSVWWF